MGLVSSYKTTATLYLYSPDASTFRKWICYGVFPTSLNFGSYSADSQGAPVSITMGLSVDRTELVKDGGISYELTRPKNLYFMWYFKVLGGRLSNVTLRVFPLLIVTFLLPSPYNFSLDNLTIAIVTYSRK